MTFLGVDYSTKKLACAIVDQGRVCGRWSFILGRSRTDPDENLRSILGEFRTWASDWPMLHGAAIEAPIVGMSGASRTALRMAMVAGAVFAETTWLTGSICVPAPMQWRKAVCGKGDLDKQGVSDWLRAAHPDAGAASDDEADAVCLALFAEQMFGAHGL